MPVVIGLSGVLHAGHVVDHQNVRAGDPGSLDESSTRPLIVPLGDWANKGKGNGGRPKTEANRDLGEAHVNSPVTGRFRSRSSLVCRKTPSWYHLVVILEANSKRHG